MKLHACDKKKDIGFIFLALNSYLSFLTSHAPFDRNLAISLLIFSRGDPPKQNAVKSVSARYIQAVTYFI